MRNSRFENYTKHANYYSKALIGYRIRNKEVAKPAYSHKYSSLHGFFCRKHLYLPDAHWYKFQPGWYKITSLSYHLVVSLDRSNYGRKPQRIMNPQSEELNNKFFALVCAGGGYRLIRHGSALLLIGAMMNSITPPFDQLHIAYIKISLFGLLLFLFYSNMYWLVPRYLLRNNFLVYCLGIVAYVVIILLLIRLFQLLTSEYFIGVNGSHDDDVEVAARFVFTLVGLVMATSAIKLFQRWVSDTQRINELEKTTIQAELDQLKNQINPHFLFNMLNNANVLTQEDPKKASQVLIKLSDFLRYPLYDSARPKVLVTADIHFLTDFLNLEKIRCDNFECVVSKQGDLNGAQVAPLLFITFVENAIKHNMDAVNKSYVHLHFDVQHDRLFFSCVNSKPAKEVVRNGTGGLGLANVKRRLELLYPDAHKLMIKDECTTFTVNLQINL